MKFFCGLLFVIVLLHQSKSSNLVRRKRFFNSLWPSEVKKDVQTGLIYAQLPPSYVHMLPGVNDHLVFQRRSDAQPQSPANAQGRFVHPTKMAILMPPHHQQPRPAQPFNGNLKTRQPVNVQPQQGPKIVMRPVGATTKLHPSITLKTKEQALPDIHKNQRFVAPKPTLNFVQPFNPNQQLPIKKTFVEQEYIEQPTPLLSVDNAPIEDFYYTREFQELLKEFNIKVDISKLPPIHDVMAVMGTENGQDTIKAINDVAKSSEGMELIKMYLDSTDGDEFYNYDDDVGTGEIQVGSEDVKYVQPYGNEQNVPSQNSGEPSTDSVPRATTTGTLTGGGKSWWKPLSWFGSSAQSTKIESLKKDAEILKNVVPATGSESYLQYWGKFLSPAANGRVPITPAFNVDSSPRRIFVPSMQIPVQFNNPANIEGVKVMPTIRLTETQFQDMVEKLKLEPMRGVQPPQRIIQKVVPTRAPIHQVAVEAKAPVIAAQAPEIVTQAPEIVTQAPEIVTQAPEIVTQAPEIVTQAPFRIIQRPIQVTQTPAPIVFKTTSTQAPQDKFQAPINVPSVKSTGQQVVPLPSTFSTEQSLPFQTQPFEFQQGNRRSFVSVSEPQRSSPYDFIATGIVHKANEQEVLKKSRSLAESLIEEEKSVVAAISDLTERHSD